MSLAEMNELAIMMAKNIEAADRDPKQIIARMERK